MKDFINVTKNELIIFICQCNEKDFYCFDNNDGLNTGTSFKSNYDAIRFFASYNEKDIFLIYDETNRFTINKKDF